MSDRPPVTDWARDFDPFEQRWLDDPYTIWNELRERCPVAHTDRCRGVYLPTRYQDIRDVAYDPEHFSSRRLSVGDEELPLISSPPVTSDPPDHRAHRQLLLPAFTPAEIKKLEPRTRGICRELLDGLAGKRLIDGAADFAQEVPVRVIASMLGVPEADGALFRQWIHRFHQHANDVPGSLAVIDEMTAYFAPFITQRRSMPGDDLISFLTKAKIDGKPLTDEHVDGTLRLLLVAGIDTTWSMIGTCLWHLALHEEDRRRLAAEPALIPTAVEELLRAYAPATLSREILEDTEIGGCPVKAGQMVMLAFGAANRDPAMFPEPDRVIIDRAENRHATFGLGIHRCLGSHLARMELNVALEEWMKTFPAFTLAPGAELAWSAGIVRGPRQVPLVMG
ncbi:MAG TPA: cytochrome P450 [Aliidongia sp.]|nr:cytochrome P450 [Aliidongia sp.]